MNCIKCGREIPEGQVFCQDCRLPSSAVSSDTVLHTAAKKPLEKKPASKKKRRKRSPFRCGADLRRRITDSSKSSCL